MNKIIRYLLLLIAFVILSFTLSSCGILWDYYQSQQKYTLPYHSLEVNDEYEIIWNTSDLRIENNNSRPMLVAAPGRIIVQGLEKGAVFSYTIAALDSMNGEIVWQIQEGNDGYQLIAHDNVLYRGITGSAAVESFSIEDGELLWRTRLPRGHSVSDLYFAENKIFVYTNNDLFYILNEQGDILETIHTTDRMFLETNGVLFMEDAFSIKAVDLDSTNELWRLELDDYNYYTYAPIFNDGTIFLMTGVDIYSIDQFTGEVEWVVSQDVMSNLWISGNKIYLISLDGYLVAINRYSGSEISKVAFSPPLDSEGNNNSYFVSGDPINNVLALSFGDNTQIMGLKIINP